MKKIAILSSDPIISRFFELEASALGFNVSCFDNTYSIIDEYDFVITDKKYFLSAVNKFSCKIGVVIRDGESDQEQLPDAMLDSVSITWPPSIKELKGVFSNIISNTFSNPNADAVNKHNIIFYYEEEPCVIWYRDKKIVLTQSEAKLFYLLCSAEGKTVSKEEINSLFDSEKGNIGEVYIHHLRRKLEEPFSTKVIHTVRAKGYWIDVKLQKN